MVKTIQINENVFAKNDVEAEMLRARLKEEKTTMINVMSSPGSGKTTLLTALINLIKERYHTVLMNVDIQTDLDASRIANQTGVESVSINNGGLCHIDAYMTAQAIAQSNILASHPDLLILENIGNLVCPAEFDTGAHLNMMLLSVPEGHDKPLKYPLMFTVSSIVVITKIDTLPIFDFDVELCKKYILNLNPNAKIFVVSAKTGEGMDALVEAISQEIESRK